MTDELGENSPPNVHPAARELYKRQCADDMLDENEAVPPAEGSVYLDVGTQRFWTADGQRWTTAPDGKGEAAMACTGLAWPPARERSRSTPGATIAEAIAIIDNLPRNGHGRPLPPKTVNRARPAMSTKSAGWGWTHYFLTGYGAVAGYKVVDNVSFMARWIADREGSGCVHLGRTVVDTQTGEFVFEPWPFPIDPLRDR